MSSVRNEIKDTLRRLFTFYIKWVALVLLAIYLLTGIYRIEQNEIGVLTRLGKISDSNVQPGLHYALPYPVDKVERIAIKQVKTLKIDTFSYLDLEDGSPTEKFINETGLNPSCITGDNNIVSVSLLIRYTVVNPVAYRYGTRKVEDLIRSVVSSLVMRRMATMNVDTALTAGKRMLQQAVKNGVKNEIGSLEERTGIALTSVEIGKIDPPVEVQDYFDNVVKASVEKKNLSDKAEGYKNRIIPEARTRANEKVQKALSYKRRKILTAEGETNRFISLLEEYKKSKRINREKIYRNFLEKILTNLREIRVVEKTGKPGRIVIQ